jgi:PAS domain S-box-containing protein
MTTQELIEQTAAQLSRGLPRNPILIESWRRSLEAGVHPGGPPSFRNVSQSELRERQDANRMLLDLALPHLRWITGWFSARPHVVYLVDRDGIVLHAEGDADAIARYHLSPGYDWSEKAMGTNGAGSALAAGCPIAVIGCDHWSESWSAATCLGAPIVDPAGDVVGALDISMDVQPGDAERLVVAAQAADAISQEWTRRAMDIENAQLRESVARLLHVERALRESESRFRTMADMSPLMIWVHDADGAIEFVNRAYCDFFGVTEEQVRGPNWQPLVHPEDAQAYVSAFFQALRSGTHFISEARVRHADGQWRHVVSYGAPRISDDGRILGMVGSSPDITEIRSAAAQLEEAARLKDEFIATFAHELRQPLQAAAGALQVIELSPNRADRTRAREIVARQFSKISRLVEDLLDAGHVVRGAVALRKAPVDIRDVVRAALETVAQDIRDKGHRLELELPAEPVVLTADPARLEQVFVNLLSNAAKYTPSGGLIVLAVRLLEDHVGVVVRDNGVGISCDALPRIFDVFTRAPGGSEAGFGIGLCVVRKLVEQHGGKVAVHSDGPGQGSEFTVRLPRA